jgi:hypothetical protein
MPNLCRGRQARMQPSPRRRTAPAVVVPIFNAYVAIESFRPLWDHLTGSGRIRAEDHPTVARVMRNHHVENRETLSLKVVDQVLIAADETFRLHELYLVTVRGVPIAKIQRDEEARAAQRRQSAEEKARSKSENYRAANAKKKSTLKNLKNSDRFLLDDDGLAFAA